MVLRRRLFPILVAVSIWPTTSLAQAQPARPGAAAPAATPQAPPAVEVNDPMLVSPARPQKTLASWRDALAAINARSVELQVALQEIEKAEGLSRQALGKALPQITATGTVTNNFIRGEGTTFLGGRIVQTAVPLSPTANAQLTISQPVLNARLWYAIGTAGKSVVAAKLRAEDARRTVLTSVATAIVSVVTAERVAEVNRVGLKTALQLLELTKRKNRLGAGTNLDVIRAEQEVTQARATLVTGDESLRQAREALGIALGTPEAVGVSQTISLNEIESAMRAMCTKATPDQRPDVAAARADLDVAERGIADVRLGYAPTADVTSVASYSSIEQQNQKNYAWSIQGVLTIPIWDGGSRYGEMRSAKATAAEARAKLEGTQRGATVEVTQALRAISVAEQSRDQSARARDLARENARLTQVAYEAGTATSFELVDAARKQREAELDLAVKEFELVRARIAAVLASASCAY